MVATGELLILAMMFSESALCPLISPKNESAWRTYFEVVVSQFNYYSDGLNKSKTLYQVVVGGTTSPRRVRVLLTKGDQ